MPASLEEKKADSKEKTQDPKTQTGGVAQSLVLSSLSFPQTREENVQPSTSQTAPGDSDEHPFLRSLSDLGRHFMQVKRERDQLRRELGEAKKELTQAREFTSRALAKKDDAVHRATDSDAKLEVLREEAKAALEQVKLEAQEKEETLLVQATEREDHLAGRLHALSEALAGALETSVSLDGRPRVDGLTDAIIVAEDYGAQAKELITRVASTLTTLHSNMFPKKEPPKTLGELVEVFCVDPDRLVDYNRAQMICGSETTLTMALVHGCEKHGPLRK